MNIADELIFKVNVKNNVPNELKIIINVHYAPVALNIEIRYAPTPRAAVCVEFIHSPRPGWAWIWLAVVIQCAERVAVGF